METISIPLPQAEELELPSRGLSHGIHKLLIRPITMREEKMLTNKTLAKSGNVHDEIFKSCLSGGIDTDGKSISKSDINLDYLFVEDEYAMYIFLRAISYGTDYDIEITCPICNQQSPKFTIDLERDLEFTYADSNTPENVKVRLPKSGVIVTMDYPRKKHSKNLKNPLDIIPRLIIEAEGIDKLALEPWIQNIIGRDLAVLRHTLQETPFGISKEIAFVCQNSQCAKEGEIQKVDMPITPEFFRL
jgi:hypothetical protein